ncbi:MAG: hypothetical protein ACR2P3_09195 [Geminicoccaceae bacterium]
MIGTDSFLRPSRYETAIERLTADHYYAARIDDVEWDDLDVEIRRNLLLSMHAAIALMPDRMTYRQQDGSLVDLDLQPFRDALSEEQTVKDGSFRIAT